MPYRFKAQNYIDTTYGINKERDSKPNHKYYISILQSVFDYFYSNQLRSEREIRELKREITKLKEGGQNGN